MSGCRWLWPSPTPLTAAPGMRSWPDLQTLEPVELTAEVVARSDVVLIISDHSRVDYDLIFQHAQLIVDTRRVYSCEDERLVRA